MNFLCCSVWNVTTHHRSQLLDHGVLLGSHWFRSSPEPAREDSWRYYFLITRSQLLFPIVVLAQHAHVVTVVVL